MTCIEQAAQGHLDGYSLTAMRFGFRTSPKEGSVFSVGYTALRVEEGASFTHEKAPGCTFKPQFNLAYRTKTREIYDSGAQTYVVPCEGRLCEGGDVIAVIFLMYRDDQTDLKNLKEEVQFFDLRDMLVKPSERISYSRLKYGHLTKKRLLLVFEVQEKLTLVKEENLRKVALFGQEALDEMRDEIYLIKVSHHAEEDFYTGQVTHFEEIISFKQGEKRDYFTTHDGLHSYVTYDYESDDQKFTGRYTQKLFTA